MDDNTHFAPRSQTPFGNAIVGETLFRMEGVSAGGSALPPAEEAEGTSGGWWEGEPDTPAWGTEFPSQVRSQTEFGNEGAEGLSLMSRSPQ